MLCNTRAVRNSVKIELRIAERFAHGFQVPYRDARREISRIVGQCVETGLGDLDDLLGVVVTLDDVFVDVAIHTRRLTGAALVDEQYVAMPAHVLECVRVGAIELNGAAAGATRERHERIGFGLEVQRGDDSDGKLDGRRIGIVRVLGALQRAATRLDARIGRSTTDTAILELERKSRSRHRREQDYGQ